MPYLYKLGKGTVLEFRGRDRNKVFNNLATQDLRSLSSGQVRESFITDPKGKSYGHGIALGVADSLLFVTSPGQAARLVPHFDRFIIMEEASVSDRSNEMTFWLAETPKSLQSLPGLESFQNELVEVNHELWNGTVFKAPWIGPDSVLILTTQASSNEFLESQPGFEIIESDMDSRDAWEFERIRAFWPWYGVDLDEKNLPQELDRDPTAISFNKGCYLGQETIARLDALGQVQKKLVKIRADSNVTLDPANPDSLTLFSDEGTEIGTIRSFAKASDGEVLALAYVKRSHFAPETPLSIGNAKYKGTVCASS